MKIGLIDVDGHNFPNLALMRISAYHKAQGDEVGWWEPPLIESHYDIVYMSKVFSDAYTPDIPDPTNADMVIRGGTGYCISLVDGKEVFDISRNVLLPTQIETMFPDYSIYPQYDFAVSMTSRGCPRQCGFCHVAPKEGCRSVKVANVSDFWNGQKEIRVLDPNITACRDKRDLMRQYMETGAVIDYTQGLDIRLINDDDIRDLNNTRIRRVHFAWDNPSDDLEELFRYFKDRYRRKSNIGMVYILTNYENVSVQEHLDAAKRRVYAVRDLGFDPYIMLYNKTNAPTILKDLQRWVNNKFIFRNCKTFEEYKPNWKG